MPNSDFEKKMQRKMDELHFVPSDGVWQKVEQQITAPKKRRLLLLLLPLLFILGGTALWMNLKNTSNDPSQKTKLEAQQQNSKDDNKIHSLKTTTAPTQETEPGKNTTLNTGAEKLSTETPLGNEIVLPSSNTYNKKKASSTQILNTAGSQHTLRKHNSFSTRHNSLTLISEKQLQSTPQADKMDETVQSGKTGSSNDAKNNDNKNIIPGTGSDVAIQSNTATAQKVTPAKEVKVDSVSGIPKKAIVSKNKSSIEWGIDVHAGVSGVSNGIPSLLKSSYATSAYYSTGSVSNPSVPITNAGPSEIKPGLSYAVGVAARKKYSSTFSLFIGINYSYFSTRIKVGQRTDSVASISQGSLGLQTVNGYYRGSNSNAENYTNQYHFIELPFGVEKQLGYKSHFVLNAGLTLSQLIHTNSLQYDGQKGIYYKDNSLVNKTQVGLFAGLNYRIQQRKSIVEIGPQFQYGLTNLFKRELYGSRHLIYVGIGARWFFHKK